MIMFNGSTEKEFSEKNLESIDDVERVYVDWPDIDSQEFRFISSRLEDGERELTPLYLQHQFQDNQYKIFDLNELRFTDQSRSKPVVNDRYEDLSKKKISKKLKNSSVPPLDLISQNSSIEIPGAKGVIDIDLRSSSESLSDDSEEYKNQSLQNFERDSLDLVNINHFNENEKNQSNPLLSTTLPEIQHSDLILNPGEYDTSRYNQTTSHVLRKFSEISVDSQYKSGFSDVNSNHNQRLENEKAIFNAAKQKYKQNLSKTSHKPTESHLPESVPGPLPTKNIKAKPTMLVAPQIKQPLHSTEKTPNFVELNKMSTCPQKQLNPTSYASKFIDRHHKESPKHVLKKSESFKDSIQYQNIQGDKFNTDIHHEFTSEEYLNKRVRSVDRLMRNNFKEETNELPLINSYFPVNRISDSSKSVNPPHVLYAYNQHGEPIIINTENIVTSYHNTNFDHSHLHSSYHSNHPQYYPSPNIINDSRSESNSPQVNHKMYKESNKTSEPEHVFKDANYKRQPTLYDENLLTKKFKEITTERSGSRFPPIPNTSDSSQTQTSGYASHHKKKEINYEQYTLRDFKNIQHVERGGGLGPNIGSDSYKQLKEKLIRQKNYSKAVLEKNRQEMIKNTEKISRENPTKSDLTTENMKFQNVQEEVGATRDSDKIDAVSHKAMEQSNNEQAISEREESKSNNFKKIGSASAKEQTNKRDAMLNYAKLVQEKQIRKKEIKSNGSKVHSANTKKDAEKSAIHELISNSDLDRLLQRHEDDKRIAEQIRIKLGKIS